MSRSVCSTRWREKKGILDHLSIFLSTRRRSIFTRSSPLSPSIYSSNERTKEGRTTVLFDCLKFHFFSASSWSFLLDSFQIHRSGRWSSSPVRRHRFDLQFGAFALFLQIRRYSEQENNQVKQRCERLFSSSLSAISKWVHTETKGKEREWRNKLNTSRFDFRVCTYLKTELRLYVDIVREEGTRERNPITMAEPSKLPAVEQQRWTNEFRSSRTLIDARLLVEQAQRNVRFLARRYERFDVRQSFVCSFHQRENRGEPSSGSLLARHGKLHQFWTSGLVQGAVEPSIDLLTNESPRPITTSTDCFCLVCPIHHSTSQQCSDDWNTFVVGCLKCFVNDFRSGLQVSSRDQSSFSIRGYLRLRCSNKRWFDHSKRWSLGNHQQEEHCLVESEKWKWRRRMDPIELRC